MVCVSFAHIGGVMFSVDLSQLITAAGSELGSILLGCMVMISVYLAFQLMRFISTIVRLRR